MKKIIICLTLLATINILNAQKIEIKDNNVLLDGKKILNAKKINSSQYSFYNNVNNEILMYKYNDNETPGYESDDFITLNFLQENLKIETTDTEKACSGFCMNSKKNMEKLLTWLVKEKVITSDGNIDTNKANILHSKYDERITERTLR